MKIRFSKLFDSVYSCSWPYATFVSGPSTPTRAEAEARAAQLPRHSCSLPCSNSYVRTTFFYPQHTQKKVGNEHRRQAHTAARAQQRKRTSPSLSSKPHDGEKTQLARKKRQRQRRGQRWRWRYRTFMLILDESVKSVLYAIGVARDLFHVQWISTSAGDEKNYNESSPCFSHSFFRRFVHSDRTRLTNIGLLLAHYPIF